MEWNFFHFHWKWTLKVNVIFTLQTSKLWNDGGKLSAMIYFWLCCNFPIHFWMVFQGLATIRESADAIYSHTRRRQIKARNGVCTPQWRVGTARLPSICMLPATAVPPLDGRKAAVRFAGGEATALRCPIRLQESAVCCGREGTATVAASTAAAAVAAKSYLET